MSEKKEKKLTENAIMGALEWSYDRAVNGIPGFDSAEEMEMLQKIY